MKNTIHELLVNNRAFQVAEIVLVFAVGLGFVALLGPLVTDDPVLTQVVVWFANILMLSLVYAGLRLRGKSWNDFGLSLAKIKEVGLLKTVLQSLVVFFVAMTGFVIGSIVMANITGIPEGSDLSGYDYMQNNIGLFLLTLVGSYLVASFGEEIIYRGFLINRISQMGFNSRAINVISVLVSALVFGLVHYKWGPMGMVQTGFMGLGLAICYLQIKRNLWALVLAHAYMDTILLVQVYLNSQ